MRISLSFAYTHILTAHKHKSWVLLISMARNKTRRPARLYFRCLMLSYSYPIRPSPRACLQPCSCWGFPGCCRQMAGGRRSASRSRLGGMGAFFLPRNRCGCRKPRRTRSRRPAGVIDGCGGRARHARRLCDAAPRVTPGDAGFLRCARQPPV
jgi:hypothetical protein